MLGFTVMLNALSGAGSETAKAVQQAIGKQIASVKVADNRLTFTFVDDTFLELHDDGQSCCESRYMTCDDDLTSFAKATLQDLELRDSKESTEENEIQFLVVTTSQGVFTVANHNEHNGYYGGFSIQARFDTSPTERW